MIKEKSVSFFFTTRQYGNIFSNVSDYKKRKTAGAITRGS